MVTYEMIEAGEACYPGESGWAYERWIKEMFLAMFRVYERQLQAKKRSRRRRRLKRKVVALNRQEKA
jgi:hypothetical protein